MGCSQLLTSVILPESSSWTTKGWGPLHYNDSTLVLYTASGGNLPSLPLASPVEEVCIALNTVAIPLFANVGEGDLYIATHGNGLWVNRNCACSLLMCILAVTDYNWAQVNKNIKELKLVCLMGRNPKTSPTWLWLASYRQQCVRENEPSESDRKPVGRYI